MAFPVGFWWGTASSSTQCEGAAPAADWMAWEDAGRAPRSGDGNGFGSRYAEDFALLAEHGLTHHRLSIEWARIEPREGHHDPGAIEHYREVLQAANRAGVHPWVCLHHFTLPGWFGDDAGGFRDERAARYFWPRHVDFCAETFGDLVFGWKPINEPVIYALAGFLTGEHPPGRRRPEDFHTVRAAILRANHDAARLLRGGGPVATVHALSPVFPADGSVEARQAAARVDRSMFGSWIDLLRDDERAGDFDLIGFSYYSAVSVGPDGRFGPYPAGARVGPMGYAPWSEGLGVLLRRLADELPDHPLLVAEHGVGTDDDRWRVDVLRDSLGEIERAIDDGVDVRGFFHWTGVDNYEWLRGFDVPFGLFDPDRNPRGSAALLRRYAERRGSTAASSSG